MLSKLSQPKLSVLASLAAVAVTGLFSSPAQAANFSVMGEMHVKNGNFLIYNNGLLNNGQSSDSGGAYTAYTWTAPDGKVYNRYDKDSWKIEKIVLDLRNTRNAVINLTTPNSAITNSGLPIQFAASVPNKHYDSRGNDGNLLTYETKGLGEVWSTVANSEDVGLSGISYSSIARNIPITDPSYNPSYQSYTDLVEFTFSGRGFDIDEAIAFNLDYAVKTPRFIQPRRNPAYYDYDITNDNSDAMIGAKVSVFFITGDGKWRDTMEYTNNASSLSLPMVGSLGGNVAYIESGNHNLSSTSTNPPGSAVPEPLTMLGAATAAGLGVAFKRRVRKVA